MLKLRDLARLGLLVSGVACAFAAAPGQPSTNAPAPAPAAESPADPEEETADAPGTTAAAEHAGPAQPDAADPDADPSAAPASAAANAEESPYQAIIARNAFGLKPPPPPPAAPEPPPPQLTPSALKLTGIVTLLGARRATFVLQEPGKPQINSDLISEGEKDGMITNLEVLQIDERAAVVRVAYGGKEMALDFVNNGLKPPTAPAAPPPGTPGAVAGRANPGMAQPGVATAIGGPLAPGAVSTMAHGAQPGGFPVNPGTTVAPGTTVNPSGLQSIPPRPTRLPLGSSAGTGLGMGNTVVQPTQPAIPPEQQALLMRAQEEISRRQGVPFPPSPPLPGIDDAGAGQMPPTAVPPVPPMPGQ